MRENARDFMAMKTRGDLAKLLGVKLEELEAVAAKPQYYQFTIPKPDGGKRLIETAEKGLKAVQRRLSMYFQSVYRLVLPRCAYGSVLCPVDDPKPRHIYTNAQQHIGKKWLLNMDIKDFFPTITAPRIFSLFTGHPFQLPESVAQLLVQLVMNQDRLPQGASASPILSNLICLGLDAELEKIADKKGWTYTRYIDDMVFSWKKRFKQNHIDELCKIIQAADFEVNPSKIKCSRVKDEPVITGLILKAEKPDVSTEFIHELENDIAIYQGLIATRMALDTLISGKSLQYMYQHLLGRLQFVRFVRGPNHKSYLRLRYKLLGTE